MLTNNFFWVFLFTLLGGTGIILLGLKMLSDAVQSLGAPIIKWSISNVTKNPFYNLLSGAIISFFVQSSSTASYMAVSYTSSGLFSFKQLCFFLFGVGLGSTLVTWLFAFNWGWYELVLVGVGFWPAFYGQSKNIVALGRFCFSIGLMMLGSRLMAISFQSMPELSLILESMTIPSYSLFVFGLAISVIARSSVVTVVLALVLFMVDYIDIYQAGVIVLAANLSAVFSLLRHYLNVNSKIKKSIFIFSFLKTFTVILGLLYVEDLLKFSNDILLAIGIYGGVELEEVKSFQTISVLVVPMFHLVYNLLHVLVSFLIFFPLNAVSAKIFPRASRKESQKLQFIGDVNHVGPLLAIEQSFQELKKMSAMVDSILQLTKEIIGTHSPNEAHTQKILKYEEVTDRLQAEMSDFLSSLMQLQLSFEQGKQVKSLFRMTSELESLADRCKAIFYLQKNLIDSGFAASGQSFSQISKFFDEILAQYELLFSDMADEGSSVFDNHAIQSEFKTKNVDIRSQKIELLKLVVSSQKDDFFIRVTSEIIFNLDLISSHTMNVFDAYNVYEANS